MRCRNMRRWFESNPSPLNFNYDTTMILLSIITFVSGLLLLNKPYIVKDEKDLYPYVPTAFMGRILIFMSIAFAVVYFIN